MLDVAIGGILAQPAVASVIAGATTARAGASRTPPRSNWEPDAEALAELRAL